MSLSWNRGTKYGIMIIGVEKLGLELVKMCAFHVVLVYLSTSYRTLVSEKRFTLMSYRLWMLLDIHQKKG